MLTTLRPRRRGILTPAWAKHVSRRLYLEIFVMQPGCAQILSSVY
jgi:hypothetical protein